MRFFLAVLKNYRTFVARLNVTNMLARELKVYSDTKHFTKMLMGMTINFKREYRRSLAERLEIRSIELMEYIVLANSDIEKRQEHLWNFILCFEKINTLIDISVSLHQISPQQEANLARMMDGIGRQVNGWRKSASKRQSQGAP